MWELEAVSIKKDNQVYNLTRKQFIIVEKLFSNKNQTMDFDILLTAANLKSIRNLATHISLIKKIVPEIPIYLVGSKGYIWIEQ